MSARATFPARPLLRAAALAAIVAAHGCSGPEPLTLRIEARNPGGLAAWEEGARGQMGPRLTREFDTALGELRIRALSQGLPEASAGEAVAAQVNGCSVRQVLLRGFAIRLARLKYERSLLRASLETPEKRGPMPGDQAPASCLAELHARQRARLGALALEIDAARRRLASAAGPDTDGPAGPDQSQAPVPLPAASRKDS